MTPTEMRDTPTEEEMREAVARAYEQGCIDTHKAIQAEPELALMSIEHTEFGEAASDYAHSVALRSGGERWLPISTAPKDGTPIRVRTYEVIRWLAYRPDGARQMKRAGRWQKHDGHGWTNCPDPHGPWQPADAPPPSTHGEG